MLAFFNLTHTFVVFEGKLKDFLKTRMERLHEIERSLIDVKRSVNAKKTRDVMWYQNH